MLSRTGRPVTPVAPQAGFRHWTSGDLTVIYAPRILSGVPDAADLPMLVLGDDAEVDLDDPDRNIANGTVLRFDASTRSLVVHTSIVGLPPVYRCEGAHGTAIGSDLHLMSRLPGIRFELDPAGVGELGRFGFPVGQRTLFRGVELLPAGARLGLSLDGRTSLARSWSLPHFVPLSLDAFIERQVETFSDAMRRIELASTFISLTAGLDTRAVFAALAGGGRLVPAVTMTGDRLSLDARIAAKLCRAYGIRHELVTFGDVFRRSLPRLVDASSRLSGGLSSIGQAPEVHLYEQGGHGFGARLSGNLGNQVGRGGTEGVSLRGADAGILADRLASQDGSEHWLLAKLGGDERSRIEFILESEIAYSSVGNFSVGNHFAIQQTPYADRGLIETLAGKPSMASAPSSSMWRMRMRDLRHRFFGEPARLSFQRTLVRRIGGPAMVIPINWGWRPAGGVSPSGIALGAATLVGMAARAKGLDDGALRPLLEWSGLPALHDFHETRRWLREDLREFVRDTLTDPSVADHLFERSVLARVLEEHFAGKRDHYQTVTFALDLALAHRHFVQR
jgi:hypothetical protein